MTVESKHRPSHAPAPVPRCVGCGCGGVDRRIHPAGWVSLLPGWLATWCANGQVYLACGDRCAARFNDFTWRKQDG